MTLERLLETGSGELAARLVIEGLPVEFVSDPGMEKVTPLDGRRRLYCFDMPEVGLTIDESVNIPEAVLEAPGTSIRLIETDGHVGPFDLAQALTRTNDGLNLLPPPGSITWSGAGGTPATVTTGQVDPAGGTDAVTLTDASSGAAARAEVAPVSYASGHAVWESILVKKDPTATHFSEIRLEYPGAGDSARIALRLDTGAYAVNVGSFEEIRVYDLGAWWFVAAKHAGAADTSIRVAVYPAFGTTASFPSTAPSATGSVTVYGARIADATVNPVTANPLRPDSFEPELLAQTFSWRPDGEWWIAKTIAIGDTTVELYGTADGITLGSVVHVGTEAMLVTGISGLTLSVTRGYWQTIPQKHWSNEGGIPMRTMHNRPLRIRGRRCYLYLYGDADDLQAEGGNGGQPVWIGHVSSEPACDDAGTLWRIQLASNAERLKGKLGSELDAPLVPRGAYYSWAAALRVTIGETISGNAQARIGPAGAGIADFTGFFETQEEFCDALTDWLASLKSGINNNTPWTVNSTYTAIPTDDGRWTIQVVVGSGVEDVSLHVQSSQDGETSDSGSDMSTDPNVSTPGSLISTALTAGMKIYPLWTPRAPDDRMMPRGHFDAWDPGLPHPPRDPSKRAQFPYTRVYLDRSVSSDWSAVRVEWPDGSFPHRITAYDVAQNYVELNRRNGSSTFLDYRYGAFSLPTFGPTRSLGRGTIEDLRSTLASDGPEYCNRAGMPFLSNADLASWSAVIAEAAGDRHWLRHREYTLMQGIDLEDLLQHEMRLYGIFPIIDSTGKVAVQSLERVTSGGDATPITVDDELITVAWATSQRAGQSVNMVTLKTGYDPAEDEWMGREIVVQDMASYAQDHEDRPLEIEPRSVAVEGDDRIPHGEAADVLRRVSDVFGYPYDLVTIQVPWTHFHLRLGDPVSLSCDHLPDYRTGRRPMVDARAIVIARRWALGEVHGTLTLLVHGLDVSGYSPTARIVATSDSGDDLWALKIDNVLYAPTGSATSSFFKVDDNVRVVEYDNESPAIVTGTIVEVSHDTIIVQFDSTWTPGASTWELCYDSHDRVADSQKGYAYIGDSGALGDRSARVYAP